MIANLISKNNRTSKYNFFLDVIKSLEFDRMLYCLKDINMQYYDSCDRFLLYRE